MFNREIAFVYDVFLANKKTSFLGLKNIDVRKLQDLLFLKGIVHGLGKNFGIS